MLAVFAFGGRLTVHDAYAVDMKNAFLPPCSEYLCGTDNLGRCVFCRVLAGGAQSVFSALAVVIASAAAGTVIGAVAGFVGGAADKVLMRITLVFQAFPSFVLAIAIGAVLGSGTLNAMLALFAAYWVTYARLARSIAVSVKKSDYIKAAKLYAADGFSLLFKYVMPEISGSITVTAALDVGNVILSLAGLSFIGLGAARPTAEWGAAMNEAGAYLQTAPWIIMFNGVALLAVVVVFNLLGDCLRDRFDSVKLSGKGS